MTERNKMIESMKLWLGAQAAALALGGCAIPVTGVVRLGDGVLRAATATEAQAFCRIDGNPIRFEEQPPGAPGVLFRCD